MHNDAPKAVYFVSLGCPKNRVDTEVMLGLVDQRGHRITESPDQADVIVVNTCGFIGEAKEESVDTILEMGRWKNEGRCERLVVTGCLSQRYAGDLEKELPEVDVFMGSGEVDKIVAAIDGHGHLADVAEVPRYLYDDATPRILTGSGAGQAHSTYVKIAEGCDRPCGFCIIPKLRGPQRSRRPDSVEAEVRALSERGCVEVNLVAQDLTTYGTDLDDKEIDLAHLVRRLGRVEGHLRWIRLHYAYPTATTDALLDAVHEEARVAKYIDVPIQHVDDKLLKIMRRGYGEKVARRLVERIRARMPHATLRTTFIVGHPGETDEAFGRLMDFVREAEFDRVGVFTYSKEEGTYSGTLDELDVPHAVAEKRRRELMRLQRTISKKKQKAMVGRQIEVLVEGGSEESEYLYEGRHEGQAPEIDGKVFLSLEEGVRELQPGDLVRARVESFADYDLGATATAIVQPARRVPGKLRVV